MRDPKRIKRILNLIETLWTHTPDQRLGQLLYNYADFRGDIHHYEDDDTEEKLSTAVGEMWEILENG